MVYHPMWWMLLDCLDKKRSSCMEGSISRFHDAALVFWRVITCDRLLLQLKSKLDPKWNSAVYTSQNCKTSSKTQHLIKTSPNLTNVKINPEKYNTNTTIFLIFYTLLVPPPPPTFLLHRTPIHPDAPGVCFPAPSKTSVSSSGSAGRRKRVHAWSLSAAELREFETLHSNVS